ncbi:hypothetical protein [Mycetocola spongiae]|uniref:hypothetical protein n=1 Tax=Mycetocola spongiae TaxID=2859226 RepID=UPI001CF58A22|nr:hypothetical protein [Mycetocola spongiae]UCR88691.1 hypothetical protein KXZ72_12105 [Mycetocola spongiae]
MRHSSTLTRFSLGIAATTLGAVALSGCAALAPLTKEAHNGIYNNLGEYTAAKLPFPDTEWIPEDASNIRVKYRGDRDGALLMYHSAQEVTHEGCALAATPDSPALNESWWPDDIPEESLNCGDWSIFKVGETTYAETNVALR